MSKLVEAKIRVPGVAMTETCTGKKRQYKTS